MFWRKIEIAKVIARLRGLGKMKIKNVSTKKRLLVMTLFDSDGVFEEYIYFFIEELLKEISKLVIIVNGDVDENSYNKLKRYTSDIIIRENTGFDVGAYRCFFSNCTSLETLNLYDEIILSNDTCFGPFVAFSSIFKEMDSRNVDFWGIDFYDNNLFKFIQSNFLVFSKQTFESVYSYFINQLNCEIATKHDACMKFERGLFKYLVENGYSFSYYTKKNNVDPYAAPNVLIEEYHCPFLKKRAFQINFDTYKNNLLETIKIIQDSFDYDENFIIEYLKNKFGINVCVDKMDEIEGQCVQYSRSILSEAKIEKINGDKKKIYIYGAGMIAQDIYFYYKNIFFDFGGFIVSNIPEKRSLFGVPVYSLTEIKDVDAFIIVGMNEKNTEEVRGNLEQYHNVLYLW